MDDVIVGANRAKLLDIAKQIVDTFGEPGEHELRISAEGVDSKWIELVFTNEDTERLDWSPELVVIEIE